MTDQTAGSASGIEWADRYGGLTPNGCEHECDGVGWVPIYMAEGDRNRRPDSLSLASETNPLYVYAWQEAERENPTDDGWHFVQCAACGAAPMTHIDRQASS